VVQVVNNTCDTAHCFTAKLKKDPEKKEPKK
jgi:hypothetical protein